MRGRKWPVELPTPEQVETERSRLRYRRRFRRTLGSTVGTLIVVAAAAVLLSAFFPVLRIYGGSMAPTLSVGEIVVSVRTGKPVQGDLIAFYWNNKVLVKRVIAESGQWVDMDEEGNVTVDGVPLNEPYVSESARGSCSIELPYQVPDGRWFVMGDHRASSIDSREQSIGCVAEEQIVGRLLWRIWPLEQFGVFPRSGAESLGNEVHET